MNEYRAEPKVLRVKWPKPQSPGLQRPRNQIRPTCCVQCLWSSSGNTGLVVSRALRSRENQIMGRMTATAILPNNSVVFSRSQRVLTSLIWCIWSVQQPPQDIQEEIRWAPCPRTMLFFLDCQSDGVEASGLFTYNTCGDGNQKASRRNLGSIQKPAVQGWRWGTRQPE